MNFNLNFIIPALQYPVSINDSVLLFGSCFAENIYEKLKQYKFDVICNTNGILFNPLSIANALHSYCDEGFSYDPLLFEQDDIWYSWWHHGSFNSSTKNDLLKQINMSHEVAQQKLKKAQWLFITWGSAYVYEHNSNNLLVANCHKVPAHQFTKRLLNVSEIKNSYQKLFETLHRFNPNLKILMSISPVRYIRDGLHENNLSKATLMLALKQLMDQDKNISYFPAYEIVNDELRDYRFFKQDWVHPNSLAISYVWQRFAETCLDQFTNDFLKQFDPILQAIQHRPLNAGSSAHIQFKKVILQKIKNLQERYPFINVEKETALFTPH